MKEKLKVGVVLDQSAVSGWKYTLLQKIQEDRFGELVVFVDSGKKHPDDSGIWKVHMRIDANFFKPKPDAFQEINVQQKIDDVPWVDLNDQEKITNYNLDLVLWLSDEPVVDAIFEITKKGVLYFFNGDGKRSKEDFLGYWEFMRFKGVITSALLLKRSAAEEAKMISRTWSMMPTLSMSRGRNEHMWKLPSLMLRVLEDLHVSRLEEFSKKLKHFEISDIDKRQEYPSFLGGAWNMKTHFCRMLFKFIRKRFYREQWILLINKKQSHSTDFTKFEKILPPKDRFWADPFLIEKNEKQYLFIEELPFATDKGHLSVMEVETDGSISPPVTILDKPYHLSYPFIFEMEDTFYMIPESYEDRNIQVYECASFPYEWKHKMNLMTDVRAFDTTLYFYNGKWWMFSLIAEQQGGGHNDELFLFFADTPFTTDWKSHPQNPIVSDVRSARPAGNIYEKDGKLIRPSQDCGKKYGHGFKLNEIEVMTETEYREKSILDVMPDWDESLTRTHSYNHSTKLTVIDAVIQRSRYF